MKHSMSLAEEPFEQLKRGTKKLELRLFDEKRRLVSFGDIITFAKLPDKSESVRVKVTGLSKAKRFEEIISMVDPKYLGMEDGTDPLESVKRMRRYYTKEEEESNGVLGIHMCLLDS